MHRRLIFFVFFLTALIGGLSAAHVHAAEPQETIIDNANNTSATASQDLQQAETTLKSFFHHLENGAYEKATRIYGGDYFPLTDWNDDVDADDHINLLKAGCEHQLDCHRAIKNIVDREQLSPQEFRFVVEFMDSEGHLFTVGPCCGDDTQNEPPVSQFVYTVEKTPDGNMKVKDLPVYVP